MEYHYYIKEKNLDKHPNPISIDKLEVILEQIKNCICNIECQIEGHGTGFFCRIPFPDFFNIKPVLMTNNHVLNKDDIAEGNIIEFTLNKEKIRKKIKITDKRKVYTNEKYDITIIELILKEDSIDANSFLDIDTKIYCDNPNYEFRNKDIYIIGNIKDYTYGKIKSIDENGNIGKKIKGGFEYYPPVGWIGFGLRVKDKFDNRDDSWIENNNSNWCIAYHGIDINLNSNEIKKIIGIICKQGFKAGFGQIHSKCEDIYHPGQEVGNGVYFSQNIAVAENYAGKINICNEDYIIVLMVRIKSSSIRCCEDAPEFWVTNGNFDEVRTYRILVKKYD